MTNHLREMLVDDYLDRIRIQMVMRHWNNSSLARRTGYTVAHIGNVLKGEGSDSALSVVLKALDIDLKAVLKDEFKHIVEDADKASA